MPNNGAQLTFTEHMTHDGVHIREPKDAPRELRDLQREIARPHAPLAVRARVEQRGLHERVLPHVERAAQLEGEGHGFVCVERAELEIRRGAFVEVPVVLRHAQPCGVS